MRSIALVLVTGLFVGCPDGASLSQFRVLTWNAANCEKNGAAKDSAIATCVGGTLFPVGVGNFEACDAPPVVTREPL